MGEKQARMAFRLLYGAGWAGAHRFYLQRYGSAAAQLLLTVLMVALWIWGGSWARVAPYLLGPIVLWLIHDGFWLHDYFQVEEEMDTLFGAYEDSEPRALSPHRQRPAAPQPVVAANEAVASADDALEAKKSQAIKLAKKQIAFSLQDNNPKAALGAAELLVKYLQQRSRRPQQDPHLAEAYLLQGLVLYQTQYSDAARKKLQMGVHLAAPFAHLSAQVEQAQGWLQKLRHPQTVVPPGAAAPQVQPGQYEALMQAGEWQHAQTLCDQTIALRQSAKTIDVPDLAQHHVHAMEIAQHLGQPQHVRGHGMAVLQLAQKTRNNDPSHSLVAAHVQQQALERLGDLAYVEKDHPTAHRYYRDALGMAQTSAAGAATICGLLQRLALNLERAGDVAKAQECWERAVAHIHQLGDVTEDSEAVSDVLTRYAAFSARHQPAQVKPLVEHALRIQQKAYRGYSMAAARAYEVFAGFMADMQQPAAQEQHLRQALLLVQVCDPDNAKHIAQLKSAIAAAHRAAAPGAIPILDQEVA